MPAENTIDSPANPAIEHLEVLIGDWRVSAAGGVFESEATGRVSFEWLEGGAFILQRWQPPEPIPSGVAIIGCDDSTGRCAMHYYDERGVARLYAWSLREGVWKQWREAPGFSQRFTGTFSDDGDTIHATWELCRDDVTWEKDFELVYQRVSARG